MIWNESLARAAVRRTPIARFDRYVVDSIRTCAKKPAFMCMTASIGVGASSLLYLLGYHEGEYPLLGFCLAMAMGSALPLLFVFRELRHEIVGLTFRRLVVSTLGCAMVIGCIVSPTLFVILNAGVDVTHWMHPAIVDFVHNGSANAMKPLWHVAMGSVVLFAIAPVLLTVWPMYLRNGLDLKSTFDFVWRRIEGIHYDWRVVSLSLTAVALILVWMPVLNLLIPGFMSVLSLGMFRKFLSSYA